MLLEPPVTELLILRYDLKFTADGVMWKTVSTRKTEGATQLPLPTATSSLCSEAGAMDGRILRKGLILKKRSRQGSQR
jgi:hypothetical protein